ncbi:proline-rich transmembrane protein 3 [Denticeps clupeoides]|uniref:proline-rich transmembrane protein 3 n=1 Tax=Denticeps clupeoides TaxID=299321 RepID=UPI0010A37BF8|nr:proline-rich transmembrane protein 3-like [Denticeps clupeoides]
MAPLLLILCALSMLYYSPCTAITNSASPKLKTELSMTSFAEQNRSGPLISPLLLSYQHLDASEASGDASGLLEHEDQGRMLSVSLLEEKLLMQEAEERRHRKEAWSLVPPPPLLPHRLTQLWDGDSPLNESQSDGLHFTDVTQATSGLTSALDTDTEGNKSTESTDVHDGVAEDADQYSRTEEVFKKLAIADGSLRTVAYEKEHMTPTANPRFPSRSHDSQNSSMLQMVTQQITVKPGEESTNVTAPSEATRSQCLLGLGPCLLPKGLSGTKLQWEDLSRTLAFTWELHVYSSAVLFLVLVGGAFWGMVWGTSLLRPYKEVLPQANGFLLLAGLLRCTHFLIDPYGTRHILPRPALTAIYNLPLPLLLWTQAILSIVVLRGHRLNFLPPVLQHPHVAGGLAMIHCSLLFVSDMVAQVSSPALPLMLQTVSVCWGLPLCLGLLFQLLSPLHSFGTIVPQWGATHCTENQARRVFTLCSIFGVLCCALQMHALLWLYGLLGDWRRFAWGWWLGQFWARLLELAWSFSMLVLASRVFWSPRGHQLGRERIWKLTSWWERVLQRLPVGPWKTAESRNWAEFMTNHWAWNQCARDDIPRAMIHNPDESTTQVLKDRGTDNLAGKSVSSTICELEEIPLWSRGPDWCEQECIISLIEFDLSPPSPIDLSGSIDKALHHDDILGVGSIFTPPPAAQNESSTAPQRINVTNTNTPPHIAYRWALDASSVPHYCLEDRVQHSKPLVLDTHSSLPGPNLKPQLEEANRNPETVKETVINADDDWSSLVSTDDITNF